MVKTYIPEKGDIVWLDLYDEVKRKDIRGPAIVLSNTMYNRNGTSLVCLITSKTLRNAFEVKFDINKLEGFIQSDQLTHIDHTARNVSFATKLPTDVLQKVIRILVALILK